MDSITITMSQTVANNHGMIFTIVQDSIRFERMKRFVVYDDRSLLGVYSLSSKVVFQIGELPRMISNLIFGAHESEGIKKLKTYKIKGRMSDKTEMALISLNYETYNEKYRLPE